MVDLYSWFAVAFFALPVQMIETLFPESDAHVYVFIPPFCQLVKLLMHMSFTQALFDFWLEKSKFQAHFILSHFRSFTRAWKYKCVNAGLLPSSVHISPVGWAAKLKLKLGIKPTERHALLNLSDLPDDLSLLIICLCTYEVWWGHRQILAITVMSVYSRRSKLCVLQTEMIKWFSNRMLLPEAECNAKLIVVLIYLYPLSSVDPVALINISLQKRVVEGWDHRNATLCFNALSPWMYTALYV